MGVGREGRFLGMEANHIGDFIDTNIIVRYLTGDPPEQAEAAIRIIENRRIQIPIVVFTEAVYVLGSQYRFSRERIIDGLLSLVRKNNVSVYSIDKNLVLQGLLMCRPSGRVSVADAMIWAAARSAGARIIYTFDRRFPSEGIELRQSV